MWFTPSVGATSTKLRFIQLATKLQFDLRTQLQISSVLKATHTAADLSLILLTKTLCAHSSRSFLNPYYKNPLRTQLQRSSTHTAET